MNYHINGASLLQGFDITDTVVMVGKKEYPVSEITSVQLVYNATFATNGVATLIVNGKQVQLIWGKKEQENAKHAVLELKQLIDSRHENENVDLSTAKKIAEYCRLRGFGYGMTESWTEKHFQAVIENLMSGEKIILPFVGLHNYQKATKHDGNYAYALTNKRIITAQQKLIGQNVVSINLNNVNDVTMSKNALMSIITIDTYKEVFNVAVARNVGQAIYDGIYKVLNQVKQEQKVQNTNASIQNAEKAPIEQIKEYKELLDMGILTQEEFEQKKKELLHL